MGRAPITRVRTAPDPALSGTTLVVVEEEGNFLPPVPFTYLTWQVNTLPTAATSERGTATARTGDTVTLQRSATPVEIAAGMMFAALGSVVTYELNDTVVVTTSQLGAGPYDFYVRAPDGDVTTYSAQDEAEGTVLAGQPGLWHYRFEDNVDAAVEASFFVPFSEVL